VKTEQIKLSWMDTFCYIAADEATRACVLIDPAFDKEKILEMVCERGYRVTHVLNTHGHSDHTAGNAAIIAATGACLIIHEDDAPMLDTVLSRVFARALGGKHSPKPTLFVRDGDTITFGNAALCVIHTPGHTKGSVCYLGDGQVFTGDTLFVGYVGRTDLPGGSSKQLKKSIFEKLYILPDETIVWPGHDYGKTRSSTIGREKENNLEAREL